MTRQPAIPPRQRAALRIIRLLASAGEMTTVGCLADRLHITAQAASRLVDRLRIAGYIAPGQSGWHRRVVPVVGSEPLPLVLNCPHRDAVALLREANEMLAVVPVAMRERRDAWRVRVRELLDQ